MRRRFWYSGWVGVVVLGACTDTSDTFAPNRMRTTAALQGFDSCEAVAQRFRGHYFEASVASLEDARHRFNNSGGVPGLPLPEASPATGGGGFAADFSGTNNQESGVDEADFVKTDGGHLYVAAEGSVEIFAVPTFGHIEKRSSVPFEGYQPQLLLSGDRLVLLTLLWAPVSTDPVSPGLRFLPEPMGQAVTQVMVIDVADRAAPRVARTMVFPGYRLAAREIEGRIRLVTHFDTAVPGLRYAPQLPSTFWLQSPGDGRDATMREAIRQAKNQNAVLLAGLDVTDFLPQVTVRAGSDPVDQSLNGEDCRNMFIADDGLGRALTSIWTLDFPAGDVVYESEHILTSGWSQVYASTSTLVLAEAANDPWWFFGNDTFRPALNLHRFDIAEGGQTIYTGSGRVEGRVRNSFAMSEHAGVIRVATTTGGWWGWRDAPEPLENHVFTLGGAEALEIMGHVGGIAEGESIWAARFVGTHGYLITFRQVDPLWTIDLSDPRNPAVIGELEVPGVSTYVHPLAGEQLLSIGIGGTEAGLQLDVTEVSLFDVSDFANPTRSSVLPLSVPDSAGWSFSEARNDHHAFQYWAPKGLLAVPLSSHRRLGSSWEYLSELKLVRVDPVDGLSIHGTIDHSTFYASDGSSSLRSPEVRRTVFMGDYVYSISAGGIAVHHSETLALQASIPLPLR